MKKLLTTEQMAEFASSGCLFFNELIDEQTNKEFLEDIGHTCIDEVDSVQDFYKNIKLFQHGCCLIDCFNKTIDFNKCIIKRKRNVFICSRISPNIWIYISSLTCIFN